MTFPNWILANGDSLQVILFFSLLFVLAIVEQLIPRRSGSLERKSRWPANLGLTVLNFLSLGVIPVSLFGTAVFAESREWGLLNRVELPIAVVVFITLLVRGFISFSTHYLMHKVPLFWRMHRVHHLDTEMDVTTTVRMHPLEFFVGSLPGIPIVLACGLSPWVLMLYELFDVIVTLWTHSNVRLPAAVDRIARYVLVTPDLHRVHHSAWQPETDSNFGAVFPIWDLIFGTYRAEPRDGHENMKLGLEGVRGREAHRLFWLLGSVMKGELRDVPAGSERSVGDLTAHDAKVQP